ncbi:MAG: hypothetical protein ACXVCY_03885 [Pseudobdellovibrionaceae bacterium]
MKKAKQLTTILLTLSALMFLTACGKSQTGLPSAVVASATKPLAYCNRSAGTDINFKLRSYTDSSNVQRLDFAYLRMISLPQNFKSDQTYITMWRWQSTSSGTSTLDTTPLQFMLLDSTKGNAALTGWVTTLRWNDIVTTASGLGITDVQTFFDRVNILVDIKDPNGQYQAIKVTNYDLSSNKAVNQTDALLPMFYVNPADYALDPQGNPRSQVLQSLHPFANNLNQGYTTTQFQTMANSFCF